MSPHPRRPTGRRRGFSIIELAVVLGTISILASIAIPRFTHSFKRARAVEAMQTLATVERFMKEYYNRNSEYPRVSGVQNPPDASYNKQEMNDNLPGWKDLGYKSESAYRYRYKFTSVANTEGKFHEVTLEAFADTDNDGNLGHITRTYRDGSLVDELISED